MLSGLFPTYCTREDVKAALDFNESARSNVQVDRALESGTRRVESQLHRIFYPVLTTRFFDWPNDQHARPWRLWLNQHEIISLTSLVAGGVTIASTDYFLRPDDGPPYRRIEIDLDSSAAFQAGNTHQRAIAATGLFGHSNNTAPAGALAEGLDSSETGVDVTDSSLIGVGSLIVCESERMIVTDRAMLDTGQNCSTIAASDAAVSITGVTAGTIAVGETILVDSERMLVTDVADTTLTVKRAFDGTVLVAHTTGADIYAPRTLTVVRGALGTTAATHSTSTALTRWVCPPPVRELARAESINDLLQAASGYARSVGSGETERELYARGLRDLRAQVYASHGRKARIRAV